MVSPQPESYRGTVDCTGPRSSYDESKRCVESLLFESRRTRGTRVKVVRLFNVFGPRTRLDDGRAVSNFITQALRGQPITVYGDGFKAAAGATSTTSSTRSNASSGSMAATSRGR